jgi:transcriptional regulator with XRE-family HTH domain
MVGEALRAVRNARGVTLEAVAGRIGSTHVTLSRWERDEVEPRRQQVEEVLDAIAAESGRPLTRDETASVWAGFHGCAPSDLPARLGFQPGHDEVLDDGDEVPARDVSEAW